MTSALVPGYAAIVLFGEISGRSTLTSCAADSLRSVIDLRDRRSPLAPTAARDDRPALQLGVGLGNDLDDAVAFDAAKPCSRSADSSVG